MSRSGMAQGLNLNSVPRLEQANEVRAACGRSDSGAVERLVGKQFSAILFIICVKMGLGKFYDLFGILVEMPGCIQNQHSASVKARQIRGIFLIDF